MDGDTRAITLGGKIIGMVKNGDYVYNSILYGWRYSLKYSGETMIYVVLGVLILAFIFFVGNTIRCYLNKPKYVDEDDENELEDTVNTKHWLT